MRSGILSGLGINGILRNSLGDIFPGSSKPNFGSRVAHRPGSGSKGKSCKKKSKSKSKCKKPKSC
jgi:hypothetical protein